MPNRRQTIIWTNADLIHRYIYAALGGNELTPPNEANHQGTSPWWLQAYWTHTFQVLRKVTPSKFWLKCKFHKTSLTCNTHFSGQILPKFCTEHGSHTAVLWTNFRRICLIRNCHGNVRFELILRKICPILKWSLSLPNTGNQLAARINIVTMKLTGQEIYLMNSAVDKINSFGPWVI